MNYYVNFLRPQDFDISIAMGADYLFEVKNIETWAPTFFKHNDSFLATVMLGKQSL